MLLYRHCVYFLVFLLAGIDLEIAINDVSARMQLVGIKRSGGDAAFLAGGNEGGSDDGNDTGGGSKNVGYGGSSRGGGRKTPAKPAMRHPHRRKGIPRRAPFAS